MKKVKKIAEKYGFRTEEVSAKTGERVEDSIKTFGMEVAKAKLEKMGVPWSSPSVSNNSNNFSSTPSGTTNSAVSVQS